MGNRFFDIKNQEVTRYGEFFFAMGNAMGNCSFCIISNSYGVFRTQIPHSGQKRTLEDTPMKKRYKKFPVETLLCALRVCFNFGGRGVSFQKRAAMGNFSRILRVFAVILVVCAITHSDFQIPHSEKKSLQPVVFIIKNIQIPHSGFKFPIAKMLRCNSLKTKRDINRFPIVET